MVRDILDLALLWGATLWHVVLALKSRNFPLLYKPEYFADFLENYQF